MKRIILFLVFILLGTIIYCDKIPDEIWKLDIDNKTSVKTLLDYNLPIILDFGADWCGPCKNFHPTLEKVNEKYKGQAIIKYVDVDKYPYLANEYFVQYIPYQVYILGNGQKYISNYNDLKTNDKFTYHIGALSENQFGSIVEDMISISKEKNKTNQNTNMNNTDNDFSLNIKNLNDIIGMGLPIILDFGADWCGPCRQFHPTLEKVCEKYKGKVYIKYIDVDKNPELSMKYSTGSIPTQVFILGNGQQYVFENNPYGLKSNDKFTYHIGALSESQIDYIIEDMITVCNNKLNNNFIGNKIDSTNNSTNISNNVSLNNDIENKLKKLEENTNIFRKLTENNLDKIIGSGRPVIIDIGGSCGANDLSDTLFDILKYYENKVYVKYFGTTGAKGLVDILSRKYNIDQNNLPVQIYINSDGSLNDIQYGYIDFDKVNNKLKNIK